VPAKSDVDAAVDAVASREATLLREENARLKRELQRKRRNEDLILMAVKEALTELPRVQPPLAPKRDTRKLSEEAAWLFLSDTQIGKMTKSYDVAEAERRILSAADKACYIAELRRSRAKIRECFLILGGDIVEGENIFASQPYEIEIGVGEQAVKAAPQALARAIRVLAETFEVVRVRAVVGNHGRPVPMKMTRHPNTSWDRVCYEVTKLLVADLGARVDFQISEDFYHVEDVFGVGHLVVHGDQINGKGTDGPFRNAVTGWIDAIPEPWRYVWCGHFHTARFMVINKRILIVNGSTESDNAYAQRDLKSMNSPLQWLAFLGKSGVLSLDPLYLE
jgi:hypothetical protein